MSTRSQESNPAYAGFYPVIAPLIMTQGIGDGKTSSCLVAQSAIIDALRKGKSLSAPTDQLECACPLLRRMAIRANDTAWWVSDEERTKVLRPLIPLLLDSEQSQEITWKRIFFVVDKVVRELTPMRLEYIGRKEDEKNIKTLRSLTPITDKKSAKKAADLCAGFKQKASASASAYAYASAYADAYASASTSASAYAYASAYADGKSPAQIKAQKLKYRTAYIQLFRDVAAIKE